MPKFTNYTEKTVPVAADKLIIADSENSNNPKSLQTGNAAMAKSSSIFTVADGVSVTAGDVVSMLTDGTVAKGLPGTHLGTETAFNAAETAYISVAMLTVSKFVVVYRDYGNSNRGTAVVGTISGGVITYGSEYVFNSATTSFSSTVALSSTKIAIVYQDVGNSSYGTAIIGDVSGTTITYGSEYVFNSASLKYTSCTLFDDSKIIIAYRDDGNSGHGTAIVGDISGSAISFGAEAIFNAADVDHVSVFKLTSTKIAIVYQDVGNSSYGTAIIGDVSGTTITFGAEIIFNVGTSTFNSIAAIDALTLVAVYRDESASNYGNSVLVGINGDMTGKLGIAQETGAETENIIVATDGISNSHTGLTPASLYYSNVWGDISTSVSDTPIGFALSATEILSNAFTFSDIFSGATTLATAAADDLILIYDTSESAIRKMTQANFTAI